MQHQTYRTFHPFEYAYANIGYTSRRTPTPNILQNNTRNYFFPVSQNPPTNYYYQHPSPTPIQPPQRITPADYCNPPNAPQTAPQQQHRLSFESYCDVPLGSHFRRSSGSVSTGNNRGVGPGHHGDWSPTSTTTSTYYTW